MTNVLRGKGARFLFVSAKSCTFVAQFLYVSAKSCWLYFILQGLTIARWPKMLQNNA